MAFAAYLLLSVVTIGRSAIADPGRVCACAPGVDPSIYMWALVWWPHAILHGTNPLFSHVIWAPGGANVASAAEIPGAAIALWPLTAVLGPFAAYNVLAILSPALASLTAYLLCRHITRSNFASFIGGFCFGFGSYELSQLLGHANLMLSFLVPVAVLLVVRRIENTLSSRRFVIQSCVVLAVQLLLSAEVLVDTLMFGGLTLLLAYLAFDRPIRGRILIAAREVLLAGAIAAAVCSAYIALGTKHLPAGRREFSDKLGLDIANLVIPTKITWLGNGAFAHVSGRFTSGDLAEAGGYVGLPLLIAFAAFAYSTWRTSRLTRVLVALVALITVAALGGHFHAGGHSLFWLPWSVARELPLLDAVVPGRFALFIDLVIAVGVAMWLVRPARPNARLAGRAPSALAALGVIALLPNIGSNLWNTKQENPRFFTDNLYKRYIARGENIVVIPVGHLGNSMLWQAETGIYFNMAFGYVSPDLPSSTIGEGDRVRAFYAPTPSTAATAGIAAFLVAHNVHHIIILPRYEASWRPILTRIATGPQTAGDVLVYTARRQPVTEAG